MDLVKSMLAEIKTESAMEHIRWLTQNTPRRFSGMGDDQRAAEYVRDRLSDCGLDAGIETFPTYNSTPLSSELKVLEPERLIVESLPCAHIMSTTEAGLTAELVDVGAGSEEEYQGKDVRGKAVLVQVSYAPPTPEKARIAAAKGAVALICMNWGRDQQVICNRGLKAVWGNPTPRTMGDIPRICGLSISRRDGEMLGRLCAGERPVRIFFRAKSDDRWQVLPQPTAFLKAGAETEEFVLVSGHLDAWEPGVTCNATGNGVMLELARVLARRRDSLKRNIIFAFWNGHEIAEAAGSTWYVDNNWDRLRDGCIANFTIDSPGIIRATRYLAYTSPELKGFTQSTLKDLLREEVIVSNLKKIGDQSFMGLGLPSIYGRMSLSEEEIKKENGATLGWWNHTLEDTLDKADETVVAKDLAAYTAMIARLANSAVLPYDFTEKAKTITVDLENLSRTPGAGLGLEALVKKAAELEAAVADLNRLMDSRSGRDSDGEEDQVINRCLMKLSRKLTGPFVTACGPYEQDSYGLSVLAEPIPLLQPALDLAGLDPAGEDYQTLSTMLVKNRNHISDALSSALEAVRVALRLVA